MWTRPTCRRSFKHKDQQHTCTLISKESLFAKTRAALKELFEKMANEIKKFAKYREETVNPDVIFFKTEGTFLAIKVKKDHLEIEFYPDYLEDIPPVSKYLQTSKKG